KTEIKGKIAAVLRLLVPSDWPAKHQQHQCQQQDHSARGRKLLQDCPEKLPHHVPEVFASADVRRPGKVHVAGVELVTGARVCPKLRPELVQLQAFSHATPELTHSRAEAWSVRHAPRNLTRGENNSSKV